MTGKRRPTWERIADKSARDEATGCLVWTGAKMGAGYGNLWIGPGLGTMPVHRWVYEQAHGPVGEMEVHHLCQNRLCLELSHLQAVARDEHIRLHGNAVKKVCPKCGGEYTVETGTWRRCMPCKRAYFKQYRAANPEYFREHQRKWYAKQRALRSLDRG